MKKYCGMLVSYLRGTKAVSALEYAVLAGVIVVAIGAALVTFGNNLTTAITAIGTNITTSQADVGSGGGDD